MCTILQHRTWIWGCTSDLIIYYTTLIIKVYQHKKLCKNTQRTGWSGIIILYMFDTQIISNSFVVFRPWPAYLLMPGPWLWTRIRSGECGIFPLLFVAPTNYSRIRLNRKIASRGKKKLGLIPFNAILNFFKEKY